MMRAPMHMDPNRGRPLRWCTLTMILLLSVRSAAAVDVGTVVAAVGSAEIARDKSRFPAAPKTSISVGDELSTGSPGAADFAFFDQVTTGLVGAEAAAIVSSLTVGERSLAVVDQYDFDPRGPKARVSPDERARDGDRRQDRCGLRDQNPDGGCARDRHHVRGDLRPHRRGDRGGGVERRVARQGQGGRGGLGACARR